MNLFSVFERYLVTQGEASHFVIALSFQGDSGTWLILPLFLMPTILLPFYHRTLCRPPQMQKIEITHSVWKKATVSSTFSTIQPCSLFLDMIENLFSLSIAKSAWVRPDGCWPQAIENGEGSQLFSLLLVVTSFGETASRSWHLEDLLSHWTADTLRIVCWEALGYLSVMHVCSAVIDVSINKMLEKIPYFYISVRNTKMDHSR